MLERLEKDIKTRNRVNFYGIQKLGVLGFWGFGVLGFWISQIPFI